VTKSVKQLNSAENPTTITKSGRICQRHSSREDLAETGAFPMLEQEILAALPGL
jgi:hypothetical protein